MLDGINIAMNSLVRAVVICLVLSVLPPLIARGGGSTSAMRALTYVFASILFMAAFTLIGSVEEALDFLPNMNLRVALSPYTWIVYLPMVYGLLRFRRAIR